MALNNAGDHIHQIGVGLDPDQLAGFYQGRNHSPMFGAAVRSGKQSILASESKGPDRALDHIGVDFNAPVIDKPRQPFPARERVAGRLGQFRFLADDRKLGTQPWLKLIEHGSAAFLPRSTAFLDRASADLALDRVEFSNAREGFTRNRRWTGRGQLVKAPAHMRAAERKL